MQAACQAVDTEVRQLTTGLFGTGLQTCNRDSFTLSLQKAHRLTGLVGHHQGGTPAGDGTLERSALSRQNGDAQGRPFDATDLPGERNSANGPPIDEGFGSLWPDIEQQATEPGT